MVALDTNVVVRVLVGDDPAQTARAERAFTAGVANGGVFVSLAVLAEVAWVLAQGYGWDRATLHARLTTLTRTRGVVLEEPELVERALERHATGRVDLADLLILGRARAAGAEALLTFDRRLAREPGARLL